MVHNMYWGVLQTSRMSVSWELQKQGEHYEMVRKGRVPSWARTLLSATEGLGFVGGCGRWTVGRGMRE
ncbi:uncharacterized protein CTRU02_201680 [Colletotrichum truncatum]|uniref:Uncharacterized protein n=1 Tax=Colletotrichum truncatum TaxID=5467 RepID=A0ACC3ZIM0_COLTU|nr:uncharacterized protein CTRU02_11566 [Colletotrichum truncatum]KAF6785580.1 hypothetical protein CTRU02_11566 [Colletotrichum truncatum]